MDLSLDHIGLTTGTDKASNFHGYLDFYDELLTPIRHKPVSVLEIGTLSGQSLRMWDAYFDHPDTKITGVDIHEWWTPDPNSRIKMHIGSGTSHEFMKGVVEAAGPFDLVIDDAGHFCGDQKQTLAIMWPYIKSGGLMVIEDTHSSYSPTYNIPGEQTFIEHMLGWIHDLNESGKDMCGKPTISDIDSILFRKSLVVLRKR
jgi:hypothetical protein